jgi:hypothetical protein
LDLEKEAREKAPDEGFAAIRNP